MGTGVAPLGTPAPTGAAGGTGSTRPAGTMMRCPTAMRLGSVLSGLAASSAFSVTPSASPLRSTVPWDHDVDGVGHDCSLSLGEDEGRLEFLAINGRMRRNEQLADFALRARPGEALDIYNRRRTAFLGRLPPPRRYESPPHRRGWNGRSVSCPRTSTNGSAGRNRIQSHPIGRDAWVFLAAGEVIPLFVLNSSCSGWRTISDARRPGPRRCYCPAAKTVPRAGAGLPARTHNRAPEVIAEMESNGAATDAVVARPPRTSICFVHVPKMAAACSATC